MAASFLEQRIEPLASTFFEYDCKDVEEVSLPPAAFKTVALTRFAPSRLRRRHTLGGYVPYVLAVIIGDKEETPYQDGEQDPWWQGDAGDAADTDSCYEDQGEPQPEPSDEEPCEEPTPRGASFGHEACSSSCPHEQKEDITTLMVRNLPHNLTQRSLLEELDNSGFEGLYDFVYMPGSFTARRTNGYAFVNFISPISVAPFMGAWHRSRRFGLTEHDPLLNISPASVQGLKANVAKWTGQRMNRIRDPNLRPYLANAVHEKDVNASSTRNSMASVASSSGVGSSFSPSGSCSPVGATAPLGEVKCARDPRQFMSAPLQRTTDPGTSSVEVRPIAAAAAVAQKVTTLMIRNLPKTLTQQTLLQELDQSGFNGMYDFVYLPCSFMARKTSGYAFINMTSPQAASILIRLWHRSRRFGLKGNEPALNISPALVQGLQANLAKWTGPRMSRIRDPALRPFVAKTSETNDSQAAASTQVTEVRHSGNVTATARSVVPATNGPYPGVATNPLNGATTLQLTQWLQPSTVLATQPESPSPQSGAPPAYMQPMAGMMQPAWQLQAPVIQAAQQISCRRDRHAATWDAGMAQFRVQGLSMERCGSLDDSMVDV